MASVILDTNIIIDYLSLTRAFHSDAVDVLEVLLSSPDKEPVVLAACLKDVYYILCRQYHHESAVRDRLNGFRQVVSVAELTNEVLDRAFGSDEPDVEDGIVRATAELMSAEAIITRDDAAYKTSRVPSMTAREYCMLMDKDSEAVT